MKQVIESHNQFQLSSPHFPPIIEWNVWLNSALEEVLGCHRGGVIGVSASPDFVDQAPLPSLAYCSMQPLPITTPTTSILPPTMTCLNHTSRSIRSGSPTNHFPENAYTHLLDKEGGSYPKQICWPRMRDQLSLIACIPLSLRPLEHRTLHNRLF